MHEGRVLKHVVIVKDEVKQNITEFCLLKERPGYTVLNGFFSLTLILHCLLSLSLLSNILIYINNLYMVVMKLRCMTILFNNK